MKHPLLEPFQFIISLLFRLCFYSLVVPVVINNVALADITLNATLKDTQIELGESTQLSVTVNGATNASRPLLPSVEGLQFISRGQNTQMQYINGEFSSTITFMYLLTPEKAGDYTIPPIQLKSGGKIIESEALNLEVKDFSTSGQRNSNSGSQALGTLGQTTPPPDSERESSSAFLRIIIPKTTLYVGESVPVEIRAYFAEALRVSLNGSPTLTGGFFTLQDSKEEPRETHEVFSARSYTVLSWNSLLSAVKEGKLPLIAQLKATMLLRERPKLPNNSMFNNPFFDNDLFNFNEDILDNFFGSVREKTVNLKSQEQSLSVEALPQEGRPEIFDGAVGDFSMKVYSNTRTVEVGDPLTLNVKIAGVGNFDSVVKYSLPKYDEWKTYSPDVKFKPLDNRGFHGEKIFDQVLIPQDPGIKELPVPSFAFFDPNPKEYRLLQGDPIPITVSETAASKQRSIIRQGAMEEDFANTSIPKKHETSLAPMQIETGTTFYSLSPLYKRDWYFIFGISLFMLMLGGAICRLLFLRHLRDPQYVANIKLNQEIERVFLDADRALQEAETSSFLSICRRAAQLRLAHKWKLEPEAVTLSDLVLREPESYPKSKRIFELADAVHFSGSTLSSDELSLLYKDFKNEIRQA